MAVHDIPKKFKSVSSARKIMAKNILDETGVILATFLPRRATAILDCYLETLRHFNVHFCPIFPTIKVSEVLLLHENARLCTSACTTKAIKKKSDEQCCHINPTVLNFHYNSSPLVSFERQLARTHIV